MKSIFLISVFLLSTHANAETDFKTCTDYDIQVGGKGSTGPAAIQNAERNCEASLSSKINRCAQSGGYSYPDNCNYDQVWYQDNIGFFAYYYLRHTCCTDLNH